MLICHVSHRDRNQKSYKTGLEQGGKCKTRLAHGFHFQKVTVRLNEPFKSAPQAFAADRQVRAKNSVFTCAQQLDELMAQNIRSSICESLHQQSRKIHRFLLQLIVIITRQ